MTLQQISSVVRQIVAVVATIFGVLTATIPALHLPVAVSAILTAWGPVILGLEHYLSDPSTGNLLPAPAPPPASASSASSPMVTAGQLAEQITALINRLEADLAPSAPAKAPIPPPPPAPPAPPAAPGVQVPPPAPAG